MKILHIITDLRKGGAERIATDIVRELNSRPGITAMLVLLEDLITYDISDIKDFVKIIPASVTLSVFRPTRYTLDALKAFVDEFRPDVIHSHLFIPDLVSRSLEYHGAKWFTHCHWNTREMTRPSFPPVSRQDIIDWWVYRYMLQRYLYYDNQFITISPNTHEFYKANLPALKDNMHYMANAINVAAFESCRASGNDSGPLRIISVGSLIERKNQMLQIEVANVLHQRRINFHLDIYGHGPTRSMLHARITALGLHDRVTLRGVNDNIGAEMGSSSVFLHTAVYEPFGLVIIEAMASGLPVVALDGGGNRELVLDDINGYLIQDPDADRIADRILQACASPLHATLRQGAIRTAQQYDIAPYVSKLLDLYAR